MLSLLKSGRWVSDRLIQRAPLFSIGIGTSMLFGMIVTSHGGLDLLGRPLGTDFSNVYSAGHMVLNDQAAAAYTPGDQHRVQKEIFNHPDVPFYGWHYPPFFLIIAAGLAVLPYTLSWLTWMAATLPVYLYTAKRIINHRFGVLAALGFPAISVNLLHGQNGFLSAALIAGALLSLRSKPIIAGLLIGLLAYKPQFGILFPIVLLAGGYYRTFATATLTLFCMCALASAVFGMEIWHAFLESRHFSRTVILEAGSTGWFKIQTLFSVIRMWGGSVLFAYIAQSVLALFVLAATIWIWRRAVDYDLKAASLITGALLMTPYMFDYDMVVMAPALLFLVRYSLSTGWVSYERSALALIWLSPLFARPAGLFLGLPIGVIAILSLFTLILFKAQKARRRLDA
ncbi:MAG: glycosyltransferase family 87 protein [Pseudomonadota bacterium]